MFLQYQKQSNHLEHWQSTKNLYQTNVTNQLDRTDDKTEIAYDLSAKKLWQQLRKKEKTFVVFSNNLLGTYNKDKQLAPWYTVNPDNKSKLDYIVRPSGRAITADTNYLKLSKTVLVSGGKVTELKPTMFTKILIVPEKYKKYESNIKTNYLSEFLFQLNSDFDEWKQKEHTPKFTRKNLKINIIYAKNRQQYFTYNPNSGDNSSSNIVTDPIITVFDDYQYSLIYGNLFSLNGGFFLFDQHVGQAYDKLKPQLRKSGMGSTINYVTSVYGQNAQLIQQNINSINTVLIQIIVFSIISFVSLSLLINQYYLLHEREIIIKRFMGQQLYKIVFGPIIFISVVFIFSNIISTCLLHVIDWLGFSVLTLIFSGTTGMLFLIILHNISKRNIIIGRNS